MVGLAELGAHAEDVTFGEGIAKHLLAQLQPGQGSEAVARLFARLGDAPAKKMLVKKLSKWLGDEKHYIRKYAAEALVAMYRSGTLDENTKRMVLRRKAKITAPHEDRRVKGPRHRDYPRQYSDCHMDSGRTHVDRGIGVEF
jgi:hypothetical protein